MVELSAKSVVCRAIDSYGEDHVILDVGGVGYEFMP